jgi:hypothetical protein
VPVLGIDSVMLENLYLFLGKKKERKKERKKEKKKKKRKE